ncbi:hypothetical protein L198_00388 [Cryptococcus wingfieldii CBS 7118]|uniref:Uncharacterized protein n=1 Tax=Cryptococcus wingfieldii CBS 7118 TaxID=1295528 RepID=A0A1E3K6W1_9TREE|nr:hypothetical protein L198_00388 [Cryptococcus wingfieldii CBS 7118]ODO08656.1 hypothetical protein L198_00388 [Cryptococcus wingfieldii CBS 7118]
MSNESIDPIDPVRTKRILPPPRYYSQDSSLNDPEYTERSRSRSRSPSPVRASRSGTPDTNESDVESIHRDLSSFNPRLEVEYGGDFTSAISRLKQWLHQKASAQRQRSTAETPPTNPSGPSYTQRGPQSYQSYAEDVPEETDRTFHDDTDSLFDIGGDDEPSAEARGERVGAGGKGSEGYEASRGRGLDESSASTPRSLTFDDFLPKSAFGNHPPPPDPSRSHSSPKPDPYLMSGALPDVRRNRYEDVDDDPLVKIWRRTKPKEDSDHEYRGRSRSRFTDERSKVAEEEPRSRRRSWSRGRSRSRSRSSLGDTTDGTESRQSPPPLTEASRRDRLRDMLGLPRLDIQPPPPPVETPQWDPPAPSTLWERFTETGVETNLYARGEAVARRMIMESQMSQMSQMNDTYPSSMPSSRFGPPSQFGYGMDDYNSWQPQSRPSFVQPPLPTFPQSWKPSGPIFSQFGQPSRPSFSQFGGQPQSRPNVSRYSRPPFRQSFPTPQQQRFSDTWEDDASDTAAETEEDYYDPHMPPQRRPVRFGGTPSQSFGTPTPRPSFGLQSYNRSTGLRSDQEPPFMRQPPPPGTSIPGYGVYTEDNRFIPSAMSGQSQRPMPFGGGSRDFSRY